MLVFSFETPVGICQFLGEEEVITALRLPSQPQSRLLSTKTPLFLEGKAQILSYLSGELQSFSLAIDPKPSEFQAKVWGVLSADIPYGERWTYTQVAEKIGAEKSLRAVGSACRSNPLPLIIPCHRVLPKNGGIGEYLGGKALKEQLLSLEQGNPFPEKV